MTREELTELWLRLTNAKSYEEAMAILDEAINGN